jgi:transposase-like protein
VTDGCPNCATRGTAARFGYSIDDDLVHGYRCPRCGCTWTTSRMRSAYEDEPYEEAS